MIQRSEILIRDLTNYWEDIANTWQENRPQKLWRCHSDQVNIDLLSEWLPSVEYKHVLKTDLFDEACSEGIISSLTLPVKTTFGIDVSFATALSAKKSNPNLRTLKADTRSLPIADKTFDVIISNSTLDHFKSSDEILRALKELERILRTGGQLLLTLDNGLNPFVALRNALPFNLLNSLGIVPYYVGKTFSPDRLREALEKLNFEVVEVRGIMHFPRFIAVLIARILEKYSNKFMQHKFLRYLMAFEHLSKWPTQLLTGQFVAIKAVKRS